MDPSNYSNKIASSSAHGGGAECSGHTGTYTLKCQTYFVDPMNVSCNSNDSAGCFDIPNCTAVSLHVRDGGDGVNANFNHPGFNEPCPNEGCGCTGSYNGGAGAGTAVCGCECKPYEPGFSDKKRDACCSCQDDTYQRGLANKKPECSADYKYVPDVPGPPKFCPPSDSTCCGPLTCGPLPKTKTSSCPAPCPCEDTYQKDLCCKKPECSVDYKYVPELPPPKPYCERNDPTCCAKCTLAPDTYELIANTDARKYKGHSPGRSNFYADDGANHCSKRNGSCNNSYDMMNDGSCSPNWTELRHSYYSAQTDNTCCPCRSPSPIRRGSEFGWVDNFDGNKKINIARNMSNADSVLQYPVGRSPAESQRTTRRLPLELADHDALREVGEEADEQNQYGRCCLS